MAVAAVGLIAVAPSVWGGMGHMVQAFQGVITDPPLTGPARVIDGDTLEVRGSRVRLHGIDAPERAQRCRSGGRAWACGREATRALSRRIGSHAVACEAHGRDRYGRTVAVCRVGGKDVNAWMVAQGWAFAYRKYSKRYVEHEAAAREARLGIWRGDVIAPWEWRKGRRFTVQDTRNKAAADTKCRIKGNVSRGGERVYHVPGGRHYDQTRIDPSKGERWFCSEAEARKAGWRGSRR